jgi:hypothetical protein
VGQLDLDFEAMELPPEPGLALNVYTAAANTPTADGLKLLASWTASQEDIVTERPSPTGKQRDHPAKPGKMRDGLGGLPRASAPCPGTYGAQRVPAVSIHTGR